MLASSKAFGGFSVDDVAKAHEFYGDVLGLAARVENGLLHIDLAGGGSVITRSELSTTASFCRGRRETVAVNL